jgi:hypothetical protein
MRISTVLMILCFTSPLFAESGFFGYFINNDNVRLRSAPSIESEVVDVLQRGTDFQPLEVRTEYMEIGSWKGVWIYGRTDDHEGFVFSPFVSHRRISEGDDPIFGVVRQGQFYPIYQLGGDGNFKSINYYDPWMGLTDAGLLPQWPNICADLSFFHRNSGNKALVLELQGLGFNDSFTIRNLEDVLQDSSDTTIIVGSSVESLLIWEIDLLCRLQAEEETVAEGFEDLKGEANAQWDRISSQILPELNKPMAEENARQGGGFSPHSLSVSGTRRGSSYFFYIDARWVKPSMDDEAPRGPNQEVEILFWTGYFTYQKGELRQLDVQQPRKTVYSFYHGFSTPFLYCILDTDADGMPEFWMKETPYEGNREFWVEFQDDGIVQGDEFKKFAY